MRSRGEEWDAPLPYEARSLGYPGVGMMGRRLKGNAG
jgi:hypothetical protein